MKTTTAHWGTVLMLSLLAAAPQPQAADYDFKALLKEAAPIGPVNSCTAGPGGSCVIKVTVDEKCSALPAVDSEVLRVGAGVHILWTLTGGTWEFEPNDGISFKNAAAPFEGKSRSSPHVFHWQSKSDAAGKGYFAYNIRLRNREGRTCKIDPGLWV